jgi:hypothetical protein
LRTSVTFAQSIDGAGSSTRTLASVSISKLLPGRLTSGWKNDRAGVAAHRRHVVRGGGHDQHVAMATFASSRTVAAAVVAARGERPVIGSPLSPAGPPVLPPVRKVTAWCTFYARSLKE